MRPVVTPPSFEHRLLEVLFHEHAMLQRPALAPTAQRAGHRRARIAIVGVAATVAAVAVAAGGLQTASRPASDGPTAARQAREALVDENVVLVVSKTEDAIEHAVGTILHAQYSTVVAADGAGAPPLRSEFWFDQADPANLRVLYRSEDGQPWMDEGFVREGDLIHTRQVDHERRVVTETRASPDQLRGEAPPPLDVDPQKIVAELSAGELTFVGEERLGGVTVVHLRGTAPAATRDLWVDGSTYLPVRATASGSFGSYEIDYRWESRTEAAVRDLLPEVPHGYEVSSDAAK
jgi:hypothetical protein